MQLQHHVETVEPLGTHRIDASRLKDYLAGVLGGIDGPLEVRKFRGGHSNPTYLLMGGAQTMVLRKMPPGDLLPGAHRIDREHRIMSALADIDFPVPRTIHYCDDAGIVGTPFYIMSYVEGRVDPDPQLLSIPRAERRDMFRDMTQTLARMHGVDWRAAGLVGFGRPENFLERQVRTWNRQFVASRTSEVPAMERLSKWLIGNLPETDEASIVHGDYRSGNLILDAKRPKVIAVLDWELSTIGCPLADLGYMLMPWHLPAGVAGVRGLIGLDHEAENIPGADEIVEIYARARNLEPVPDLRFYIVLAIFRLASIVQGVYARALQGNASDAASIALVGKSAFFAEAGWRLAEE